MASPSLPIEVCRSIRRLPGGYVVEVRHPYGVAYPYGEVVCHDFNAVVALLRAAALEKEGASDGE